MAGGVHGRGCVWQGVCMAGGVHGGGMHDMGGGCARQKGVRGGGYVWEGVWMEGVCVVGDVRAGDTSTKAGGTHPTLMHSCF